VNAVEIYSYPESLVRNSQPHGIGRVANLAGLCAWNNLGRNVVFAGHDLRPRAVFDESAFTDDERSQYDLDVHAILEIPSADIVITLNHFGIVRAFLGDDLRRPGPVRRIRPLWTRTFAADVERAIVVDDRLVGSQPRERNANGVLVSEPLDATIPRKEMDVTVQLPMWGKVSALTAVSAAHGTAVALGGDGRVSLASVTPDGVGRTQWDADTGFQPAVLLWDGAVIWAAGSERPRTAIDDYDWEALHGGGFAGLDPTDGKVVVAGRFPDDLAWGTGGVAVVRIPGGVCGIGRTGELHVARAGDGASVAVTAPIAARSLGIAHAAAVGPNIVYGFNRGGYRLHTAAVAALLSAAGEDSGRPASGHDS
jgi:hypothetical protein